MSVRLRPAAEAFECSMCPEIVVAPWRDLASQGWVTHVAGKCDPIRLCGQCATVIANRRAAACGY